MANGNTTRQRGIEQGRAEYAYRCVKDILDIESSGNERDFSAKKYKQHVKKVPTLIKANGLGPAFAFIKTKMNKGEESDKRSWEEIYNHTKEWIRERCEIKYFSTLQEGEEERGFLEDIIRLDTVNYRMLTTEIMALFSWLKRLSDGLITS